MSILSPFLLIIIILFSPPESSVDLELAVAQKDIEISQMQERIQELETTIALNFQRNKAQVTALEQHISSQVK